MEGEGVKGNVINVKELNLTMQIQFFYIPY